MTIDGVTPSVLEEYMSLVAPRSANVTYYALRSYYKWRVRKLAENNMDYKDDERRLVLISGVKPRKVTMKIEISALTPEQVIELLSKLKDDVDLYTATVLFFYFGWRPVESTEMFVKARIDWDNRYMILKTAKAGHERILVWHPYLDEYVMYWYLKAKEIMKEWPSKYAKWYTVKMHRLRKKIGMKVTAKTGRKTFETQMRSKGIDQWIINFILGHTTNIPDVYTDWTKLIGLLRDVMCRRHYLVGYVIPEG